MAFEILAKLPEGYEGRWVSTYLPIAGWKAVMYWWNPEGFTEPWQTSPFAFETEEQARQWGLVWARDEGVPYVEHKARPRQADLIGNQ